MAKEKGKKSRRRGKRLSQPHAKLKKVKVPVVNPREAIIPVPAEVTTSVPVEATASHPTEAAASNLAEAIASDLVEASASDLKTKKHGGDSRGKKKEREKQKRFSGFIFMCNSITKLDCYQYRVFGLPAAKKEVVEDIKPGTKLFLYDFELKLLYGVYEATSAGKLNLEPASFRGRYPAQVKFKISMECLPLPESSLKIVLKEIYNGPKFNQELTKVQVRKLVSSFRPLAAISQLASQAQPAPRSLPNVPRYQVEVPYLARLQHSWVHQPIPQINYLRQGYQRIESDIERMPPALHHQISPAPSSYIHSSSMRPKPTEGVAYVVQEPPYSRYRITGERTSGGQVSSLQRQSRTVEERAPHEQTTAVVTQYPPLYLDYASAYNSNPTTAAQHSSSATQAQAPVPYYPLPLHTETASQGNAVAGSYTTAPIQYASTENPSTQYASAQYASSQYDAAQYTSVQHASSQYDPAQYTSVQYASSQYDPAQYTSVQYASSVAQPQDQAPGGAAPLSYYNSYAGAWPGQ